MSDAAQKFLEEFGPNVAQRLEALEKFAEKVDSFLFKDEPGKPSLETIARGVHKHVEVWCTYAALVRKVFIGIARFCKRLLVIISAITAAIAALVAVAHYFGVDLAHAQALNEKGTFKEYAKSFVGSPELSHFGVLLGFGSIGVCAHYFWKWITDQITGSLWKYLFVDHPKNTIASFCCIGVWAVWAVDPLLTWTQTINLALTTGFAIDVLVNKATRSAWTDEERAAKFGGKQ